MDGRCKNCKWWELATDDSESPLMCEYAIKRRFGVCHKIPDGCNYDYSEPDGDDALNDSSAYTVDGSGYRSAIFTGPEFGCVHFEERP